MRILPYNFHVCSLLCALLYLISPSTSTDWKNRCSDDCTQTVGSRSFSCEIQQGENCKKPLPYVSEKNLPPRLHADDIDVSLISDTYGDYEGQFPGINVSVSVPLTTGSQVLNGIQIILRGKGGDDIKYYYTYNNNEICRILNLSKADMKFNYKEGLGKVTFYYDCMKPLSPESEYEIEVRLLPTTKFSQSPSVKKRITTPRCNNRQEIRLEPHECLAEREEYKVASWSPTIFQVNMTGSEVKVAFDLPKKEYNLDQFRLLLYKEIDTYVNHTDIKPNEQDSGNVVATSGNTYKVYQAKPFKINSNGKYHIKLQPVPTGRNVCKSLYDESVDCRVTTSPPFSVNLETTKDTEVTVAKSTVKERKGGSSKKRGERRKDRKNKKDRKKKGDRKNTRGKKQGRRE